ncbi:hypothetical protein MRX96_038350 [Rhipicephalus microplus]
MQNIDMPPTWIDLLQRLYSNNMVIATFGQTSMEPVSVRRGLKQGCPLSPLLYILYTAGLEWDLIGSGRGFALRFQYAGSPQVWTLPGLVFADDLVLLAENTDQLQNLIDVQAAISRCCSETNETAEHLILDCTRLSSRPAEGTTPPQALRFSAEDHDANDATAVATTKARLQMWWKATMR